MHTIAAFLPPSPSILLLRKPLPSNAFPLTRVSRRTAPSASVTANP
eukprot:CAMPEP_0174906630 /NCGR_PEP_ID=MMETSP0167-20121228/57838_1 /TAXON_ID=38298 /ORGANISM="Rhodella maculata, Strain CCMP736" /LENGTH=45 /DNA_ID= /DNA_START= /DNA_END= /DNA_ORIENTATION=